MYIIKCKSSGDMLNGRLYKGAINMLGLCTPITKDQAEAATFETLAEAELLLPKLNLSPYAKWEAVSIS